MKQDQEPLYCYVYSFWGLLTCVFARGGWDGHLGFRHAISMGITSKIISEERLKMLLSR